MKCMPHYLSLNICYKWKIFISEFDCILDYIKGEDNFVADIMSRLVSNLSPGPENTECIYLAAML